MSITPFRRRPPVPSLMSGIVAAALVVIASTPRSAAATTRTVCSAGCDSATVQGAVNASSPGDVIRILTTQPHTEADIVVSVSVVIEGLEGLGTTIQAAVAPGGGVGRVLTVLPGTTVVLRDLTLRHGDLEGDGAGILNLGDLTLFDVVVRDNTATGGYSQGGGIYNEGSLTMRASDIVFNDAYNHAGGIYNDSGATLEATDCSFSSNTAFFAGNLYNLGSVTLLRGEVAEGWGECGAGGIYSSGQLTLTDVRVENNDTSLMPGCGGGGLRQGNGSTSITGGWFLSNSSTGQGGAILSFNGSIEIADASMSYNRAEDGGGIAVLGGAVRIERSTLYANVADPGDGGGIWHDSPTTLRITSSTLTGNEAAGDGGALFVADERSASLSSSTVVGNVADEDADGVGDGGGTAYGTDCTGFCLNPWVSLENTIIAGNEDLSPGGDQTDDCSGDIVSEGYNLVEDAGTGPASPCRVTGDLSGVMTGLDPMVEALAYNGGRPVYPGGYPTKTHALEPSSPAIDMGDPSGCVDHAGDPLPTDQRGAPRLGPCDVGAFEYGSTPPTPIFSDGFESGDTSSWSG